MLKSNVIDIISEQGEKKEKVSRSGESLKSFETNNEKTRVKEAAAAQADPYDDHYPTIEISSDDDEEDDEKEDDEKEEVEGDAKLFEEEGVPITSQEVRAPMGVHKRVRQIPNT